MAAENRAEEYREVSKLVATYLEGETDWIAAMATTCAILHRTFSHYDWTGFYRVSEPGLLVLGPFQGMEACFRIPFDRGVCGACATSKKVVRVDDVSTYDGHIACSSSTISELVSPVLTPNGRLLAVLDVDSNARAAFSDADEAGLRDLCDVLGAMYEKA